MKWYNKSKTFMLNLDLVSSFSYKENPLKPEIKIIVDGREYKFYDDDAKELHKLLTNTRQVL